MIYPGAWTIGKIGKWKTYIDTPSHYKFASVYRRVYGEDGPEDIAGSDETIRLIVSAPKLLDLVKRALDLEMAGMDEWLNDAHAVLGEIEHGKRKK